MSFFGIISAILIWENKNMWKIINYLIVLTFLGGCTNPTIFYLRNYSEYPVTIQIYYNDEIYTLNEEVEFYYNNKVIDDDNLKKDLFNLKADCEVINRNSVRTVLPSRSTLKFADVNSIRVMNLIEINTNTEVLNINLEFKDYSDQIESLKNNFSNPKRYIYVLDLN